MSGSAIRRLTLAKIADTVIALPPLPEQHRIVAKIDALSACSKRARTDLDHVEALAQRAKHAVLDAAFRGRLAGTTVGRWQTRQLSALLADLRYGTATKCGRLGAVPVLRIPNVQAGRVNLSDLKYADFDKQEVMRLSLEEGDLLIVRSNGSISLVGQCAVVPRAAEGMLFAGYLIRLRVDRNEVDPEFLHLMLSSPFSRGVIEGQAKSTSGVNNINGKQIEALVVPCPPIHDQKTTVRKATALMQRIERLAAEALKASTLLDQLDQATLSKAFRGELVSQDLDDEPANLLLDRIRGEREANGAPKRRGRAARARP